MTRTDAPHPEDLLKVAQTAVALGLHGVFLLAPKCPGCGKVHNFAFFTDLDDDEVRGGSVQKLMADMARQMATRGPDGQIEIEAEVVQ